MGGWTRPTTVPPPGPTGPVWGPAPAASSPVLAGSRAGDVFAAVVAGARRRAGARFPVLAWDDPAEQIPAPTEGPGWVRLTPQLDPPVPVCVSPDIDGMSYRFPLRVAIEASIGTADPASAAALTRAALGLVVPLAPEVAALGVSFERPRALTWRPAPEGTLGSLIVGEVELWFYEDIAFEEDAP